MKRLENTDKVLPCADYDRMVRIWLDASVEAHDFISREFWVENAEAMRTRYLPAAENYACLRDGEIVGFISLIGNCIEALFVEPRIQGTGVGTALLNKAVSLRKELELSVYSDNKSALGFYIAQGFRVVEERTDPATGCREKVMRKVVG